MVDLGLVFQWNFLTEVDWKKGPHYFAAPPIKRWESGLSHLTCFGQWDIDKHVSNRGSKKACDVRVCLLLLQLESWGHHMKKHTLAFWKGHIKKNLSTLTGYLPNARHVSGTILDPPSSESICQLTADLWVSSGENIKGIAQMNPAQLANPQNCELTNDCCFKQFWDVLLHSKSQPIYSLCFLHCFLVIFICCFTGVLH